MLLVFRTVTRVTSSTIGLGREAYLYHKEKKEARKVVENEHGDEIEYPADSHDGHDEYEHGYDYEYGYTHGPIDEHAEKQTREMIAKGHAVLVADMEMPHPNDIHEDETAQETLEREWEFDEEGGSGSDGEWSRSRSPPPAYEPYRPEGLGEQGLEGRDDGEDAQHIDSVTKLAGEVIHRAPPMPSQKIPLTFPVIIPQRRPRKKARGFIRAYAPDLAPCGIDQDTFLHFLHNFDRASEASPWLQAVYTSAGIVGFIPGHITLAVSISVQFAAGAAIELQSRYKANRYLDQMNKDLFMPRGLYVMVMRYKPSTAQAGETEIGLEDFNLQSTKAVARWAPGTSEGDAAAGPPSTGMKIIQRIRLSSGVSRSNATMPTACAPLVFQTASGESKMQRTYSMKAEFADGASSRSGSISSSVSSAHKQSQSQSGEHKRSLKEKLNSANAFVQDYYDRRAQARLMGENPNSVLAQQIEPPKFRSRYADPNNETNKHLFNLVTGGHAHAKRRGEERRLRVRQRVNAERAERGLPPIEGPLRRQGIIVKCVKKVLVEDMLYLLVVNLPSEEELSEARHILLENGWMK
ncbi:hypothetical protein SS1G_10457 [Paecilomyces variotii No. 5]|uniref:Uncharacterized protein n=1 Tax=Byssochlamys spectabilis (strain No. 5 / NBRC 109023) TaxID=1356009 RepID=V5G0C7_BYSSN|nr:hypothetical protein SS1G_10457 [Paecilomyces variotii No. 5]